MQQRAAVNANRLGVSLHSPRAEIFDVGERIVAGPNAIILPLFMLATDG